MIPHFRDDGWLPSGHHASDWEEVVKVFGGKEGTRRADLTRRLCEFRDALRTHGISGKLLLDGSYISAKPEPSDFDVLLIGPADIQVSKDGNPTISELLDAQTAERNGYSLFYIPNDSLALPLLSSLWDISKQGVSKGVVEVPI